LKRSQVHCAWERKSVPDYATGVSLHSHTLHSRESLDFIERATENTPWLSGAIRKQRAKYRALKGRELDLTRAWWTPPLAPRQAWELEKQQIETLGMRAMVSISDHDNIDAGLHLRVLPETRECPVSIEWTVPFRQTFFHIGIHNLPFDTAVEMTREMNAFTKEPCESRIVPMLEWMGAAPGSLAVLNHPLWDENHIGETAHRECLLEFLHACRRFLHGLELNGLRPWRENRNTIKLAERYDLPVVSGGDRHGREPNACINLTKAATFAEFASQVREGQSEVLFLPQYREPLKMRILENLVDILEDDPRHGMGWVRWSDRVFYLTDEGIIKSLSEHWRGKYPAVVSRFVALVPLVKYRRVRWALRYALSDRREFAV